MILLVCPLPYLIYASLVQSIVIFCPDHQWEFAKHADSDLKLEDNSRSRRDSQSSSLSALRRISLKIIALRIVFWFPTKNGLFSVLK